MCREMEQIYLDGENRGIERGRVEGRAEGRAVGILSSLKNLIKSTGWTVEQAMDTLGIPVSDRPEYFKLLGKGIEQ